MSDTPAGWYDDGSGTGAKRWWDGRVWTNDHQPSSPSGGAPPLPDAQQGAVGTRVQPHAPAERPNYVVLQVILKEKFLGTGSGNLTELEGVLNRQASFGYRLHTITTASSGSKGFGGGDRIQATLVFESVSR